MARGTLGTGMMAPLSMANNFNGPYYAGPSGAAMGALMASQAIADGFRDWGESKGRQQEEARVQTEMDRKRMDELNQRSAVYQALNPGVQMQSANGMSNRDMDRKMAMPDAGTQISLYKFAEDKRKEAQAQELEKKKNFANAYFAQGGHKTDPTGEKFAARFGYNPYEIGSTEIIARMEEKEAQRQWQEEMKREGYRQAQILAGMRGGGGSNLPKPPTGYRYVINEMGETALEAIAGGPADIKQQQLDAKQAGANAAAQQQADMMLEDIGKAKSLVNDYWFIPNAGVGSYLSGLKGTNNYNLDKTLLAIKARIGFDELQKMRQNSPTGGALGQVAVQELDSLQSMLGSIDPGQTSEQLMQNLNRLEDKYLDVIHGAGNWARGEDGRARVAPKASGQQQPTSLSPQRQKVGPRPGTVVDGYEYLGGDPNDQRSWRTANGK